MTRINLVPPEELCDQHLLAEFRELTRIPNGVVKGTLKSFYKDAPVHYTLGKGHVKFFVDKLGWLLVRYIKLTEECLYRGFRVVPRVWPLGNLNLFKGGKYKPTVMELELNTARIKERMPVKARWTRRNKPEWV